MMKNSRNPKGSKNTSRRAKAADPAVKGRKAKTEEELAGMEPEAEPGLNLDEAVAAALDGLEKIQEKRYTTREQGLALLTKAMRVQYLGEFMSARIISVTDSLLECIRKGKTKESCMASETLGMLVVTAGERRDDMYTRIREVLNPFLKACKDADVVAAALHSYAIACFICPSDEVHANEFLRLMESVFCAKRVSAKVRAEALSSWCLIASTFGSRPDEINSEFIPRYLPVFRSMLEHPSLEVRDAAGRCLALLYTCRFADEEGEEGEDGEAEDDRGIDLEGDDDDADEGDVDGEEETKASAGAGGGGGGGGAGGPGSRRRDEYYHSDEDEDWEKMYREAAEGDAADDDESGDESDASLDSRDPWDWRDVIGFHAPAATAGDEASVAGSVLSYDDEYDAEEMEEQVETLLHDYSKGAERHRSKRDKRAHRSAFREYLAAFKGDRWPVTPVRLRTSAAELYGWQDRIQFEELKRTIVSGLQVHIEDNPFMSSTFSLSFPSASGPVKKMGHVEKRMFMSPNSHASRHRTSTRATSRSRKTAAIHAVGLE